METITIERIEGDIVVCEREDMTTIDIPISELPADIKVGNVLIIANDGSMSIDKEEEERRRDRIFNLYEEIFYKGPKGN